MPLDAIRESRCGICHKPVSIRYSLERTGSYTLSGNGLHFDAESNARRLTDSQVEEWKRRGYSVTAAEEETWYTWTLAHQFPFCEGACAAQVEERRRR